MRRAPVVLLASAAGLVGVLGFRAKSAAPALGGSSAALGLGTGTACGAPASASGRSGATASGRSRAPRATSAPVTTLPTTTIAPALPPTSTAPTTTVPASASATGELEILSVSVMVSVGKLTHIDIATLDDGGNFRSQAIDEQAIPILEQEALQAQSANVQAIAGASNPSAGFAQSLQSALSTAGR
ncbi:MAG: hypothetical protein M0004_17385 [Actinomycetota bacterium]|nr:hypothetical protein [Actinomycetota bacterium]